jgi:LysM repeat protein
MKLIHTIYLAAALSTACAGLHAQTTGSGYFLHTVAQGQSVYSIANMYGVKAADIIRLNPGSDEKIKAGATLKIPQTAGGKQKFHTIQAGETLYQLTVRYGVPASRICAANPGLSAANFRAGQVIAIPTATAGDASASAEAVNSAATAATTPAPSQKGATAKKTTGSQTRYRDIHQVEKKETIYSISRLYGITEEELIEANPELRTEKLKKGAFVGIPYAKGTPGVSGPGVVQLNRTVGDTQASDSPSNDELFNKNRKSAAKVSTLKVGVMLPFMTQASGNREEQMRMVEYYEGFLMAVDSLKNRGTNIDLYTYDTGKDAQSLQAVLERSELKDMHLIFGPGYASHVKPVADFHLEERGGVQQPLHLPDQHPAIVSLQRGVRPFPAQVYGLPGNLPRPRQRRPQQAGVHPRTEGGTEEPRHRLQGTEGRRHHPREYGRTDEPHRGQHFCAHLGTERGTDQTASATDCDAARQPLLPHQTVRIP